MFSTVSIYKPHVLHRLSLTGPPFFLRDEEQDEDLDKANNLSVMDFFKGLEMVQPKELPYVINVPEVSFAENTTPQAVSFFTVPRPGLNFQLFRHERHRSNRPSLHEALVLVKENRTGNTAVAFASCSTIRGSTHVAAEHFSKFHGTFYHEQEGKVLQVNFHHLADQDQMVWETWTSNAAHGSYSRYAPSHNLVELLHFASLNVDLPREFPGHREAFLVEARTAFTMHFSCFANNPYAQACISTSAKDLCTK